MSATVTAWTPRSLTRPHAVSRMCARALGWVVVMAFDTCKTRSYCTRVKCYAPGVDRMGWSSPYEPIETGEVTLDAAIVQAARAMGDRVALIDGRSGAAISYAQLAARIDRAAAGLSERGLGPGDVLALWAPNSPEWAIAALGAMAAGATVTGVSPACVERELAVQLADSGASMLVAAAEFLEVARAAGVREVVALDDVEGRGRGAGGRARPIAPRSPCCPTRAAPPGCRRA